MNKWAKTFIFRNLVTTSFVLAMMSVASPLAASVLSDSLLDSIQRKLDIQFGEYQKGKTFTTNQAGALVAIDPTGAMEDEIILRPGTGETLEVLYLDRVADLLYYRAFGPAGERAGKVGIFGQDPQDIIHSANRVIFSGQGPKLYWASNDAVRSINLDGTGHKVLVREENHQTNNLSGWAWLGSHPWGYCLDGMDWLYFHGDIHVIRQSTSGWFPSLDAAGVNGWTWWANYPWVYVDGFAGWIRVEGNLWTWSNKLLAWDLLENTSAPTVSGIPKALHFDETRNALFFQLTPTAASMRSYGSIQKLDLATGGLSTAIDLTNATNIQSMPGSDRIYWSESDGLHTSGSTGLNREFILTTPLIGGLAPTIRNETAPMMAGTLYKLSMSPHAPETAFNDLQLNGGTKKFEMGFGRDFLSGTFTWNRRAPREVAIDLEIDEPVTAFPDGVSLPYAGRTVQEIYLSSGGGKDLPTRINITLTYRDSSHGAYREIRYLASQNMETVTGDFTAQGGDFSGLAPKYPNPPVHFGATITGLSTGDDGSILINLTNLDGSSTTMRLNSAHETISSNP